MKLIALFSALLLTVAIVSASYPCGINTCGMGEICHSMDAVCRCMPYYECHDVTLTIKCINTWTDSETGCTYSQFDVTITNHLNRNIKQMSIGNNAVLRDINSIWGVVRTPNTDFILLSNQDINANAQHTFGFIIEGRIAPIVYIKSVTY